MFEEEKNKKTVIFSLEKIKHWCAYQERCQEEVRQKLFSFKLPGEEIEQIISSLIIEGYLSEERFAKSYVRGKFTIKHWGKLKIKAALKGKKIPDKLIVAALKEIDSDSYFRVLLKLLEKKSNLLKEKNKVKKKLSLLQYAYSKGYEQDLVVEALNEMEQHD